MLKCGVFVVVAILTGASSAWPCEVIVQGDGSREGLVRAARVVVRAKAERVADSAPRPGVFPLPTRVRFQVVTVYKGMLDSDAIEFNGLLTPADDSNANPLPYTFGRPRSNTPSCYNPGYVQGAEYLLLLGSDEGIYSTAGELTPYWSPVRPTNEQVVGDEDPWLTWVIRALGL